MLDFVPIITHDALRIVRRIANLLKHKQACGVNCRGGGRKAEALRGVPI